MCPQLADNTKIAEVHHTHYGIYEKLRCESQSPEAQTFLKVMKFQKVRWSGQVPMKLAKRQFGT